MKRAFVAFLSAIVLTTPAWADKKEEQKAQTTDFLAEAIAIDSVCNSLQVHMEYLFIVLQRAKINLDEILPEAGVRSASYMPDFAEDGEGEVCRRGAEYYGPQGNKFPNMLTLE